MNEKIMAVLGKTNPNWALDWANEACLRQYAMGQLRMDTLRAATANRYFHAILHAAVVAGIVEVKE